ncbi:unnamed protein product [Urochloa humidicola]
MDVASANLPDSEKKMITVFVDSTGCTGKRVVEKLSATKGFGIVVGTTCVGRARGSLLPQDSNLQLVRADVTEGVDKLVEAVP